MKNIIIIMIFTVTAILAQDNKGRVTLTLNGEKFDMPINSVSVRKENKILINIRAEESDSVHAKIISMELAYNNLTQDEKNGFDIYSSRIQVSTNNNHEGSGSDFILDFRPKGEGFSVRYSKSERVQSNFNYLSMKIYDQKITYDGNVLVIELSFSGEWGWNSTGSPGKKNISKIQDCTISIRI